MIKQAQQDKIEETDIINKVSSQLIQDGYPVSGMVTSSSPFNMKIYLSQIVSDNSEKEIKLVVRRIAKQNGFDKHSVEIAYDDE